MLEKGKRYAKSEIERDNGDESLLYGNLVACFFHIFSHSLSGGRFNTYRSSEGPADPSRKIRNLFFTCPKG
jgi:hypothetical protein